MLPLQTYTIFSSLVVIIVNTHDAEGAAITTLQDALFRTKCAASETLQILK